MVSAATANVARTRQKIVERLARLDVSEDDVKTSQFTAREELDTGYSEDDLIEVYPVARQEVVVTVADFTKIGKLIDASLSAGATGISSINYSSTRASFYEDEALAEAVAIDGRTEVLLSPLQFLARLVDLLAPPRKHRRRYFGVLAPRARLRPVVTATAGPVLQELAAASDAARVPATGGRGAGIRMLAFKKHRVVGST